MMDRQSTYTQGEIGKIITESQEWRVYEKMKTREGKRVIHMNDDGTNEVPPEVQLNDQLVTGKDGNEQLEERVDGAP